MKTENESIFTNNSFPRATQRTEEMAQLPLESPELGSQHPNWVAHNHRKSGDLTPLTSLDSYTHVHILTHRHIIRNKIKNKKTSVIYGTPNQKIPNSRCQEGILKLLEAACTESTFNYN